MASTSFRAARTVDRREAGRSRAAALVRGSMEAVVLVMVCLSPWAFGAVAPNHLFLLDLGIAVLMILWAARMLLDGQFSWRKCPVAVCLAAWVLVGLFQITPLPKGLLGRISPATARIYDRLLPARPEVLPFEEPTGVSTPLAGSTLSFYPGSTQEEMAKYLAILLLFVVVRNNIASPASLQRLGLVAVVNGSLLALFGLVQAFSAEPETIYWYYPAPGLTSIFGPYINRNHFAFHVNVCVGLGVGLLLGKFAGRDQMQAGGSPRGDGTLATRVTTAAQDHIYLALDPAALGMIFALTLMIGSVVYSLSRGGFLALLGGLIVGLVIRLRQSRWSTQGRTILLTLVTVVAVGSWFGYDRVVARLKTSQDDLVNRDGRVVLWSRSLPLVEEFPLWGTGLGTYEFVEALHRSDADHGAVIVDHAHNDYLEALVEGGLVLFVPVMVAVVLVFRFALRAVRRVADQPVGGLVLGALMALTMVAIHSFSDFGMHIPANAVIVTVLCAQLCAVGQQRGGAKLGSTADREFDDSDRYVCRLRGLAPVFGAVSVVALGLVVVADGWRVHRAQQLRLKGFELDADPDQVIPEQKAAVLEAATRLVPGYGRMQSELARTHLTILERRREELAEGAASTAGAQPGPSTAQNERDQIEQQRFTRLHLVQALRHFVRSRDVCPLRAEAHMAIAEYVDKFKQADPREAYLERAKFLGPNDADLWKRCGIFELADGRPDRAWTSWRRSLELSESALPEILNRSDGRLGHDDINRLILPDRPDVLLASALHFYPQPAEGRRPFLERALAILNKRTDALGAPDLHLEASINRALGQPIEALTAYRASLAREPLKVAWRYEFAELLYEQNRFDEAFEELRMIQLLEPENAEARKLMDAVQGKIAEER
jgi:O-antigen ligase/tetratricopeptide (TPR) repeat protein